MRCTMKYFKLLPLLLGVSFILCSCGTIPKCMNDYMLVGNDCVPRPAHIPPSTPGNSKAFVKRWHAEQDKQQTKSRDTTKITSSMPLEDINRVPLILLKNKDSVERQQKLFSQLQDKTVPNSYQYGINQEGLSKGYPKHYKYKKSMIFKQGDRKKSDPCAPCKLDGPILVANLYKSSSDRLMTIQYNSITTAITISTGSRKKGTQISQSWRDINFDGVFETFVTYNVQDEHNGCACLFDPKYQLDNIDFRLAYEDLKYYKIHISNESRYNFISVKIQKNSSRSEKKIPINIGKGYVLDTGSQKGHEQICFSGHDSTPAGLTLQRGKNPPETLTPDYKTKIYNVKRHTQCVDWYFGPNMQYNQVILK